MSAALRESVDTAIAREEWAAALAGLRELYRETPGLATAQFILDRIGKVELAGHRIDCRVAVLRSFTLEPMLPLLRASSALHGVDITTHIGDFNTYVQDILTPESALYAFDPEIVVLAVQ